MMMKIGQSTPSPAPHSSGSSGFSDDDSLPFEDRTGLTLLDFVEHLKQKGRRGLLDEYAEIVSKNPEGSFNVSRYLLLCIFDDVTYGERSEDTNEKFLFAGNEEMLIRIDTVTSFVLTTLVLCYHPKERQSLIISMPILLTATNRKMLSFRRKGHFQGLLEIFGRWFGSK